MSGKNKSPNKPKRERKKIYTLGMKRKVTNLKDLRLKPKLFELKIR